MSDLTSGERPGPDEPRTPHRGVPTHPLEIVTARVEELTSEAQMLRTELFTTRQDLDHEKVIRRTAARRFYATMAALGLVLVGISGLLVANVVLNSRADETLTRLNDCLVRSEDPDSCYAEQQARTRDIVGVPQGPINTVTLLTAACSQVRTGEEEILQCVQERLAERNGAPDPGE